MVRRDGEAGIKKVVANGALQEFTAGPKELILKSLRKFKTLWTAAKGNIYLFNAINIGMQHTRKRKRGE